MDATACRVLERLVVAATDAHRTELLTALTADADTLFDVATSPYGSHLLEALLTRDATTAAIVDLVATHIADLVDHKYGSFVARHVLRMLCEDEGDVRSRKQQQGLAALLAPPPPRPTVLQAALVQRLVDAVAADPTLPDWPCHQFASPFLQALLRVVSQADWCRLVAGSLSVAAEEQPEKKKSKKKTTKKKHKSSSVLYSSIVDTPERVDEILRDRVGSHFVEAVFATAPSDHVPPLYRAMIQPSLPALSTHPHANFAVQAALRMLRGESLAEAIAALTPHASALLTTQRGGVVVALTMAATAEPETHGAAVCAMLAAPGKRAAGAHAPLLFLLGGDTPPLWTIGCALLHLVFSSFTQAQSQVFGNALATLPGQHLVALARAPAGVRVLESFLLGPASKKQRRTVLHALHDAWGDIATGTMAGCVFAEKCASVSDVAGREAIVKGLAGSMAALQRSTGGAALVSALHVEAYVRDPEAWRRRQAGQGDKAQFLHDVLEGGVVKEPPRKKRKQAEGKKELDGFVDMLSVGL